MPYISLPETVPEIASKFAFWPETAKPVRGLAHMLLYERGTIKVFIPRS